MHLEAEALKKYQKDAQVVWPTFSSCTYDEEWLKRFGLDSVAFEIRSYGAVEASTSKESSSMYLPCLIEDHVLPCYVYQKEVVLPPFCSFRVVNVNKAGIFGSPAQTRIFLETTQFPSVWHSIEGGQEEDFAKWAKRNEDLLSVTGNDVSLVNEIAKAAVKVTKPGEGWASKLESAKGMLKLCARLGAPVSEVDPETGSTPVFTLAEGLADLGDAGESADGAKEGLCGMIKELARSGANLTIPHKGKRLDELVPDLAKELKKEDLLSCKWQYWVDDGIHGKSDGWYDYDSKAWQVMSGTYDEWLSDGVREELTVKSGFYTYKVHFGQMKQTNTTTGKQRRIRRLVCDPVPRVVPRTCAASSPARARPATAPEVFESLRLRPEMPRERTDEGCTMA